MEDWTGEDSRVVEPPLWRSLLQRGLAAFKPQLWISPCTRKGQSGGDTVPSQGAGAAQMRQRTGSRCIFDSFLKWLHLDSHCPVLGCWNATCSWVRGLLTCQQTACGCRE